MDNTRNENVTELIDERVKVYGEPTVTFPQIAQVWSGIIGHEVNPSDVPLMLIGMKLVRTAQAPDYSDNSDDIEGYLDIFRKIVGDDMVNARSVEEYIAKKFGAVKSDEFPRDWKECINTGEHISSARHARAACPVVRWGTSHCACGPLDLTPEQFRKHCVEVH